MLRKTDVLHGFFKGLINGLPVNCFFSPLFIVDEGMMLDNFIAHEVEVFNRLSNIFKLENIFSIYVNSSGLNWIDISLLNECGDVAYEWVYFFDENNLIIGNNSNIQSVAKLQFTMGTYKPLRSLVIESKMAIREIFIKNKIINLAEMTVVGNGDGFLNYIFEIENDDFKTEWMDFIFYGDGFKENKRILMRGIDRLGFTEEYPVVKENRVTLKDRLIWGLNVWFDDDSSVYVSPPNSNVIDFEKKVKKCIVTDTLDHDWIVYVD